MPKDVVIFRFKASTKGGQRANRRETGIQLRHLPTGLEVKVKGRNQSQNLKRAFEILGKRLKELRQRKKKRILTRIPRYIKEKRLKERKERAEKKQLRRKLFQC